MYLDDPVVTLVDSQPIKLVNEPTISNLAYSDAYYSSFSNPQSAYLSSIDPSSNSFIDNNQLINSNNELINQLPSLSLPYTALSNQPTYQQYSSPRRSGQIKGIPSGGIDIYAAGYNFSVIAQPLIYVEFNGTRFNNTCELLSDTQLKCKSPSVPSNLLNFPNTIVNNLLGQSTPDYIPLDFGFIMDDVRSVQDLSKRPNNPFEKFLMYKEPEVFLFHEMDNIRYLKSERLDINGRYFTGLLNTDNIYIQIGSAACNVTSIESTRISCRPPLVQPKPLTSAASLNYASNYQYNNKHYSNLPEVVVSFGGNHNFTLGRLSYELPNSQMSDIPKPLLYLILFSSMILIVIVIIILIAYKRKSNESSRVLKTIQEQMDVLELRVAKECKEAFAELQTITGLNSDFTGNNVGIPFLEYRIYTVKVLFPNHNSFGTDNFNHLTGNYEMHPVLREMVIEPSKKHQTEKALNLFGQLVMNKTFLLLFIRTLEQNRYFSMRDRVNVASLIMVCLQGKLEYCTDILKTLLRDLIEKCADGKQHPKLLLRRTESVAEKMLSAWFTFLLHKFLKENVGEPLYMLYRAMKFQVDKGKSSLFSLVSVICSMILI